MASAGNEPKAPMVLYRPVGQREYELIAATGFRRFPPRLPQQPFFYPVANEDYATQIARDWNTQDAASGYTGYVLRFCVDAAFLARYPERIAGSSLHKEYWIPAEDLEAFNDRIVASTETVSRFAGASRPSASAALAWSE